MKAPATAEATVVALGRAWREERAQVLTTVARRLGDFQLAEDAVQESFASAMTDWDRQGVPDRPGAWLMTTAWRKALDEVRRRQRLLLDGDSGAGAAATEVAEFARGARLLERSSVDDDLLALIFICCHPALAPEAQVALTLRHVAGLVDVEIAAMLLLPVGTLTKRLVRARAKIRDAGITFELPDRDTLRARLDEVHSVLYLMFTEGHLPNSDTTGLRGELCAEAVWLADQVHRLMPDDDETTGLTALLLLHHSRRGAREDADGDLVGYRDQDRRRWDHDAIARAKKLLATTAHTPPGRYRIEAAIALLHTSTTNRDEVDWPAISRLYDVLGRVAPSPVVEVNRAVAYAHAHGPHEGLAILRDPLGDPRLQSYVALHAAHAELLEGIGDVTAAVRAWQWAAELSSHRGQQERLLHRATELSARDGKGRCPSTHRPPPT